MSKFNLKESYGPKNFLDLYVPEEVTFDEAEVVVVPFGYEKTVTFGRGTAQGPKKLIEASWQVELFNHHILDDIQNQIKIWTTTEPKISKDPITATSALKEIVTEIIRIGKFPVVIGGEHSISYGFAQALSAKYKNISILVFDAHLDLVDRYSGKDFSHASWLRYSLDLPNVKKATILGARNYNLDEYKYWQANRKKVNVFLAEEKKKWRVENIINSLEDNVFLSFDLDALDSSIMPATGTPEPGGIFFDETLMIIKKIMEKKNIIGIDMVELAPARGLHASDFLAAKLLMKMILYKFKNKGSKK